MSISQYLNDTRFRSCNRAFLVTGTADHDKFNRNFLRKNKTGYWVVKPERVQLNDLMFFILPNPRRKDGYPRELYAGIVQSERRYRNRAVFSVERFINLPNIDSDVKKFLNGNVPPQGNHVLQIWGNPSDVNAHLESEDEFNPENVEDARKWINASIVRRQGQGKFRADVLAAYGNRCAISASDVPEALEAAHIFRYLGAETNVVTNGLLLRSDLHTLYDLGLMAIAPASMKVIIAPRLKGSDYGCLDGKAIRLPLKSEHRPSQTALEMHVTWAKSMWK